MTAGRVFCISPPDQAFHPLGRFALRILIENHFPVRGFQTGFGNYGTRKLLDQLANSAIASHCLKALINLVAGGDGVLTIHIYPVSYKAATPLIFGDWARRS